MHTKSKLALVAAAVSLSTLAATAARADMEAREAEALGLHQLCDKGDRRACVKFGIILGENAQRHADWRKRHAEWWWWEK
jgi:hypothetical protein